MLLINANLQPSLSNHYGIDMSGLDTLAIAGLNWLLATANNDSYDPRTRTSVDN